MIMKYKIVVFCDSAFFHGKDIDVKTPVATNHDFWDAKIRCNMERDREVNQKLEGLGYKVIRFWDSEINKHTDQCVEAVQEAIIEVCMDV